MTVRRSITFCRVLEGEILLSDDYLEGSVTTVLSATATLLASALMLAGVVLIKPLFQQIACAEEVLRSENVRLESGLRHAEAEFQIARAIQQKLFPASPPDAPRFDISGSTRPAEATGGDYYDFIPMANGQIGIVIADVSGHGIGPALLMAEVRAYLRCLVLTTGEPGEILTRVNRLFAENTTSGRFVTLFFVRLNPNEKSFVYAAAGHQAYCLKASGKTRTLASTSIPIGVVEDTVVPQSDPIGLQPGDIILLVTDGITEARSPDGTCFGIQRTLQVVRSNLHHSAGHIVEALYRETARFSEPARQDDDMSAVVIKALA